MRIGDKIEDKKVVELGERLEGLDGAFLLPVRLEDGTYGIASAAGRRLWVPNTEPVAEVLRNSTAMPTIQRGVGSGVMHVRGQDAHGPYLIKLYYNDKAGRHDSLYR